MWEVGGIERTRAQYFCSSQPSMVNLLSSFLRKGKSVWRLQEFEEEFQRSSEVTHAYRKVIGFERKAKGKRIGQQQAEEGWDESVQGIKQSKSRLDFENAKLCGSDVGDVNHSQFFAKKCIVGLCLLSTDLECAACGLDNKTKLVKRGPRDCEVWCGLVWIGFDETHTLTDGWALESKAVFRKKSLSAVFIRICQSWQKRGCLEINDEHT